jgi:hypothetical protein
VNSHRQRRHPVDPVEHTPSDPPVATQQRRRARRTRRNRRYNRNQAAHVQTERRNLDMKRFNESVGLIVQKLGYEIALRPSNEDSTLTEGEISELVNRLNVIIEDRAIEVQFLEEMGNSVRENNFQDRSHSQDVRRSHHYVNAVTTRNTTLQVETIEENVDALESREPEVVDDTLDSQRQPISARGQPVSAREQSLFRH